jgi:hypothetical protein
MAIFGLQDGIEYIETSIKAGKKNWVMNTDFGKVCVEVVDTYDMIDPVDICEWRYAPETDFTKTHQQLKADFYLEIGSVGKKNSFSRHVRVIEGMIQVLFMSCLHTDVPQKIIDAAVQVYLEEFEDKKLTQNFINDTFKDANLSFLDKRNPILVALAENVIATKMELADEVIDEAGIILSQYRNTYHFVQLDFGFIANTSERIFAIMLYAATKDPDIRLNFERQSYHMIVDEKRSIQMNKIPKESNVKLIKEQENILKPVTRGGEK